MASTELHFVADPGEQAEFLHVLRPQQDAAGGFFILTVPTADLRLGLAIWMTLWAAR